MICAACSASLLPDLDPGSRYLICWECGRVNGREIDTNGDTVSHQQITRREGIAGQYSVTAETDDGPLTFVSSVYGGPVVMITPSGVQTFVSDPGRFAARPHGFGPVLSVEWVENFLRTEIR